MCEGVFVDMSQYGHKLTEKTDKGTMYELSEEEGYGRVLACKLFPGIYIYYNDYNTTYSFSGKYKLNNYFQISYSHQGTYEVQLKDNRCIYIGEGELIAFYNIFESVYSRFPMGVFKGFGIIFDIDTMNHTMKSYLSEFGIDINKIMDTLCINDSVFALRGNTCIRNILEEIYLTNPLEKIAYIKIKVLELLNLLHTDHSVELKYSSGYYEKKTIQRIKVIKEYLTNDLSKHITIAELAKRHNLSQTMLKNCFKDIYGAPPYEFLKQRKMEYAAMLMRQGENKISEIAGLVGYQNASKFSSAFKDVMGVTPRKYSSSF